MLTNSSLLLLSPCSIDFRFLPSLAPLLFPSREGRNPIQRAVKVQNAWHREKTIPIVTNIQGPHGFAYECMESTTTQHGQFLAFLVIRVFLICAATCQDPVPAINCFLKNSPGMQGY